MSQPTYITHDRPGLAGELRASHDASAIALQARAARMRGRPEPDQGTHIPAAVAVPMAVAAPASAAAPAPSAPARLPAPTPPAAAPARPPRRHPRWHDMSLADLDRY